MIGRSKNSSENYLIESAFEHTKKKAGFKFNLRFNSACRSSNNWALNVIFTGFKEHSRFDKKLKEMLKVILFMNNANRKIKYY